MKRARASHAGTKDAKKVAQAERSGQRPQTKAADQTDDLLNPTEEELRGIAAPAKGAEKAAQPEGAARKTDTAKPDSAASADAAPKANANAPAGAPRPQIQRRLSLKQEPRP